LPTSLQIPSTQIPAQNQQHYNSDFCKVALQGCVIVALQGCVIVALRGCVIVELQGCVILGLQCCVIVVLQGCHCCLGDDVSPMKGSQKSGLAIF
jgi:hypothetical protein